MSRRATSPAPSPAAPPVGENAGVPPPASSREGELPLPDIIPADVPDADLLLAREKLALERDRLVFERERLARDREDWDRDFRDHQKAFGTGVRLGPAALGAVAVVAVLLGLVAGWHGGREYQMFEIRRKNIPVKISPQFMRLLNSTYYVAPAPLEQNFAPEPEGLDLRALFSAPFRRPPGTEACGNLPLVR